MEKGRKEGGSPQLLGLQGSELAETGCIPGDPARHTRTPQVRWARHPEKAGLGTSYVS